MTTKMNVPIWRVLVSPAPPAGQGISFTTSGDAIEKAVCGTFTLTTSAAVATRAARIETTDGTNIFFRGGTSFTQPANTTYRYGIHSSGADFGDPATVVHLPLPSGGLILLPGFVCSIVVANMQAGDQLSDLGLLIEEYPSGPGIEWQPISARAAYERS